MRYYIGIEELVANALIEIVENTQKRSVTFKQLNEYEDAIINILKSKKIQATLIYTKDKTNTFFYDCSDFFDIIENDEDVIISLKEEKTSDELRDYFRTNMSLELLEVFVKKEATNVLLK